MRTIKSDVYTLDGLRVLFREIADLLNDNKRSGISLCAKIKSPNKTNNQLNYLFGVVYPCVQRRWREDGNDHSIDYIDLYFKDLFFYEYDNGVKVLKSKAGASKKDMIDYIDNVINWCALNLGIIVPPPPTY